MGWAYPARGDRRRLTIVSILILLTGTGLFLAANPAALILLLMSAIGLAALAPFLLMWIALWTFIAIRAYRRGCNLARRRAIGLAGMLTMLVCGTALVWIVAPRDFRKVAVDWWRD